MPAKPNSPVASSVDLNPELESLRQELRCLLQHPAIAPDRQQTAEVFISRCKDATQLTKWLALAVTECGRWEEQALAAEGTPAR